MILRHSLMALLAAAATTAHTSSSGAQTIPATMFVVRNGTAVAVQCQSQRGSEAWSAAFGLPAGGEWHDSARGVGYRFRCAPPVVRKIYVLQPGNRNVLLRDRRNAPITLRNVAP